MDLRAELKKLRPTLSDGSLTTYCSILRSLHKQVFKGEGIEKKDFDETEKILNHLEDLPPNRRKTILSALVVMSGKPEYRKEMLQDIKDYTDGMKDQEKSESQKENWVSKDDIMNLYNEHKQDAMACYKKNGLSMNDLQTIQQYIILSLLGGVFIPPRRSLDYCCFKIKDVIKDSDNYIDKNDLVFNTYKTSKFYGEQKVPLPKELKSILTKWIKCNPTSYLLFDSNQGPLSSVKLNQRLNKLFGKKTSVNLLRHSYLTDRYEDDIARKKEMDHTAQQMGTSSSMVVGTYIKK